VVLALAIFVAIVSAPAPDPLVSAGDPQAARDLVALMRAGEHATYVAQYTFTRIDLSHDHFTATQYEARAPEGELLRDGPNLTIDWKGKGLDCALVNGSASCAARAVASGLPESEVLRVAVDAGIYNVTRAPDATIAGEAARCFVVRAAVPNRQLPNDFGTETDTCYDASGVPLRAQRYTDQLNELEAVRVVHRFDAAALQPLLAGFDRTAPPITQ